MEFFLLPPPPTNFSWLSTHLPCCADIVNNGLLPEEGRAFNYNLNLEWYECMCMCMMEYDDDESKKCQITQVQFIHTTQYTNTIEFYLVHNVFYGYGA